MKSIEWICTWKMFKGKRTNIYLHIICSFYACICNGHIWRQMTKISVSKHRFVHKSMTDFVVELSRNSWCRGDYNRRGLDWWMNLLTTCTRDSELRVITAPSIISTIRRLSQHPLSLIQPAVFTSADPWQRLLTVEILQLHAFKSSLHRIPYRTDLVPPPPVFFLITPRHEPRRNTPFSTVHLLLCDDSLLRERVTEALPRNVPGISSHLAAVA
jgi:hypothetical protein